MSERPFTPDAVQLHAALSALLLECPAAVVDDVRAKVDAYVDALAADLETTKRALRAACRDLAAGDEIGTQRRVDHYLAASVVAVTGNAPNAT